MSLVPLGGAVVQAAFVAQSGAASRTFTAITDATGFYRIVGLPSGRFAIGFQHDALNALGLEAPLRAFELAADTNVTVDLAIPSGAAVRAQRCGEAARGSTDGMLAGYVLDARTNAPLGGASVLVNWVEVEVDHGRLRTVPHRITAIADGGGKYLACGLASDVPVGVQVAYRGRRELTSELSVPVGWASRQDFRLADSADVRGTAILIGHVLHEDKSPLSTGRASIAQLALDVPIRNGDFTMTGIPAGTWVVEARAIGYEPRSALVDMPEGARVSAAITMGKPAQLLDAVTVVGKPSRDIKVLSEILLRNRVGGGTTFLPGNSWLETATFPADVVRVAHGFSYRSQFKVTGRHGCSSVAVYLDGFRYADLETLTNAVPMKQVLAIEAYPDVISMPYLWRTRGVCAVIAVWTKQ